MCDLDSAPSALEFEDEFYGECTATCEPPLRQDGFHVRDFSLFLVIMVSRPDKERPCIENLDFETLANRLECSIEDVTESAERLLEGGLLVRSLDRS